MCPRRPQLIVASFMAALDLQVRAARMSSRLAVFIHRLGECAVTTPCHGAPLRGARLGVRIVFECAFLG